MHFCEISLESHSSLPIVNMLSSLIPYGVIYAFLALIFVSIIDTFI